MTKHVVIIFLLCSFLFIPAFAYSAETEFDIKTGYFMPTESAMDEIYGSGFTVGGDLIFWFEEWGLGLGLDYWKKDGTPYTYTYGSSYYGATYLSSSCEASKTNFTITGLYRMKSPKKVYPYFGAGLDICKFEEELKVTTSYSSMRASGSENGYGAHLLAGVDILVSEAVSVFFEANLSSILIDTGCVSGDDFNIGGFTLYGGIRF